MISGVNPVIVRFHRRFTWWSCRTLSYSSRITWTHRSRSVVISVRQLPSLPQESTKHAHLYKLHCSTARSQPSIIEEYNTPSYKLRAFRESFTVFQTVSKLYGWRLLLSKGLRHSIPSAGPSCFPQTI